MEEIEFSNAKKRSHDKVLLDEAIKPHEAIIVGWKNDKIVYCRTFNHTTDMQNMLKAYDYVNSIADSLDVYQFISVMR